MRHYFSALSLLFALFSSASAWGYYAVLDNAEVLPEGRYKLTGDLQFFTEDSGMNAGGRFDVGFGDEFGMRGIVGFGETDIFVGGMFRWVPVPDVDNQPAMALNMGVIYGKDSSVRDLSFRLEPMLSKKIEIQTSVLTPYAALPVSMRIRNSDNPHVDEDTEVAFQLVLGSQIQLEQWKNLQFMAEFGFDLDNAPGYVAAAAVFYFDEEQGMVLE